jgi:isopentenyl diphosphate isomerase/L-lactate dehydrogenase-like FMN-dependent dehydrogenase
VKRSMQLMGCSSVHDLDPSWLMPARDGSSPLSRPQQ